MRLRNVSSYQLPSTDPQRLAMMRALLSFFPSFMVYCTPDQSHRQLRIPRPTPKPPQRHLNIRSHNRNIARDTANRCEEIPEQHKDAVQFNQKPCERPTKEDQDDASRKRGGAFKLLPAAEEECGLFPADYYCKPDQEEDLVMLGGFG